LNVTSQDVEAMKFFMFDMLANAEKQRGTIPGALVNQSKEYSNRAMKALRETCLKKIFGTHPCRKTAALVVIRCPKATGSSFFIRSGRRKSNHSYCSCAVAVHAASARGTEPARLHGRFELDAELRACFQFGIFVGHP
jgi:hypothetical protein